jgi:hypothetical protein
MCGMKVGSELHLLADTLVKHNLHTLQVHHICTYSSQATCQDVRRMAWNALVLAIMLITLTVDG